MDNYEIKGEKGAVISAAWNYMYICQMYWLRIKCENADRELLALHVVCIANLQETSATL